MVGRARFELATPCPPDKCANLAALLPDARTEIITALVIYHKPLQLAVETRPAPELPVIPVIPPKEKSTGPR